MKSLVTRHGLLILITLIAVLPRLFFLSLIEFKADEALTVASLEQFITQPHLIQAGLVSSTGARNFPLFQYLLILPSLISTHPQFLSGVIAALNSLAIIALYLIIKRFYPQKHAFITASLMAVSPWAILFSRKIWAQDLLPLFAVPIVWLILTIMHRKAKPMHHLLLGILIALQAQLHASGIFVALIYIAWLIITHKHPLKPLFIGLIIGALPALPYIMLQITSQPFCPDCVSYLSLRQQTSAFSLKHIYQPPLLLTSFSWSDIMGESDYQTLSASAPITAVSFLTSAVIIFFFIVGLNTLIRQKPHAPIPIFVFALIGLYLLFQVPPRLFYYHALTPWLAFIAATGFIRQFQKSGSELLFAAIAGIITVHLLFIGLFFNYLAIHRQIMGDYGVIYQQSQAWVESAITPYQYRSDLPLIRAHAHFDTVLFTQTNGGWIHYNLARYFYTQNEIDLARKEIAKALAKAPTIKPIVEAADILNPPEK
jgi:hypothetical protein